MKSKKLTPLDELNVKCLTELPLVLEVISATGNKLKRIFEPLMVDLLEVLQRELPKKWKVSNNDYRNIFYPLTSSYGKDNITELSSYFALYNEVEILRKEEGVQDSFEILMGFYYDVTDEENGRPCYYFQINRTVNRKQPALNPLHFYKEMQSRLQHYQIKISHTEQGYPNEEITLTLFEHNSEAIEKGYDTFRDEILKPFLQSIG